jgi:hypothetical protein
VAIAKSTKKLQMKKNSAPMLNQTLWAELVSANLGQLWWKSVLEPNTGVVEHFLIFPTVIFMPWYNKLFGSYDFWKSTRLLKFCSEHIQAFWEFCNPDPNSKLILGNFHFQHHSWLSHLSGGNPCASIWLMVLKLRSFKVVGAARNSYWTKRRKLIDFGLWY